MANIGAADRGRSVAETAPRRSPLKKLYVQVLIAIAAGILLGAFYPSLAVDMKPLSDAFITLIRAVVPPIIFATVAVGIAKMGDMRRIGVVDQGDHLFRGGLDHRAGGRASRRQSVAARCRPAHRSRLIG